MSVSLIAVLTLSVIAGCYGNTYKLGPCPKVVVMDQVDFDRFSGEWYVIQRFNPMATCTKLAIEKGPDGVYAVNETSRPLGLNFGFHQQYIKARKINFLTNNTNSIFRLDRNLAYFTLSTFGVIETDYDKYAVVWGCDPVLLTSVQNVDILSRQPSLDSDTLKSAKDALKEMHIDVNPLDNVDHSRCGNSGNGEGTEGEGNPNTNNMVAG